MNKVTSVSLWFLAAGLLTSVSILSGYQVLFTVALAFYCFQAFKDKELKLPKSAYWLLAFLAIATLTTILNYDIIPKPSKNFGRLKYFLYGIGGIYVCRYWLKETSDKTKRLIVQTFLVSVVVAGLYVMFRYVNDVMIQGIDKRGRPLTETMRYGYGSAMILLSLISSYLHRDKLKEYFNPKLMLTAIIIGFLGMFLTYTRGALLGFLAGLPFVLFFYKPKLAKWGILGSGLVLGTLAGFYFFGTSTNQDFRLLSTKSIGSDQIRSSQWQAATIAIKERPVLGWGLSNFHSQLKRIKNDYDLPAKDYNDAHAHNLFLEVGAGTGLVGLFLFLAWLVSWAWECFKAGGMVRATVIPFGVALVLASQFEVTLDANNASMIFFIYALSAAASNMKKA